MIKLINSSFYGFTVPGIKRLFYSVDVASLPKFELKQHL